MDVTVSNFPVQVNVTSTPIEVVVAAAGVAGPPGPVGTQGLPGTGSSSSTVGITGISITGGLGFTGNFNINAGTNITLSQAGNSLTIIAASTSADVSGLISTGNADLRYLNTGSSGYFYPWSNPNNFLRSGDITQANTSGLATSGNLESTGTSLQNQFNNYYLKTNPDHFSSSGNVENTGTALQNQLSNYYLKTNPNQFATSGNLETTGTNLQNQITDIKNNTGVFIQNSNLNGLITTGDSDLRYLQTGVSGEFLKNFNLNGLINSGDVIHRKWVTGINIFGPNTALTGHIIFSPGNGIGLGQSAVGITISSTVPVEQTGTALQNQIFNIVNGTGVFIENSNLNGLANSGNLESTGTSLQNQINNLSVGGTPNAVYTTGNQYISGLKVFTENVYFYKTGFFDDNTSTQGNKFFNEVVKIGRYYDTESNNVVGFDDAPSHGIGFHRNWEGTTTGKLGGIFAFPGQNWAGGLLFQTNDTAVGPTGPMKTVMILQGDGKVMIATGGIADEKLHVDGFVKSNLGYKSGDINISDIFYPRNNPNNYIASGDVNTKITNYSGNSQFFRTLIPTGIDIYFISFPVNFINIPKVVATIEITGDIMYGLNIRNITTSGYSGLFSDVITEESGIYVNSYCSINN